MNAHGIGLTIADSRFSGQHGLQREGQLEVRLARCEEEVLAAQALRYEIFHREMGARASPMARATGRDIDRYDAACDHLLVFDHGDKVGGRARVVGTYRLLRQKVAEANAGFYTAGEYDLSPLLEASVKRGQLLELGRSCVAPQYRTSGTISLLWRGIASYLARHEIGLLFGCASFPGADPRVHAAELSLLHQEYLAPADIRARALMPVRTEMLAPGNYDRRAAMRALPPLVKGYLRVGAMVGDGAFVDHMFNTVDMFVVMPVENITRRYLDRFAGAPRT